MASADKRTLVGLQQDAERSWADLCETVGQLRNKVSGTVLDLRGRVSPEAMKAEVGEYLGNRANALMERAGQNPLQARGMRHISPTE